MGFITVITNLTKMFLLILLGFLVVKLKVMPGQTSKPISSLMLKVCLPASMFVSMVRPFDPLFLTSGVIAIISCAVLLLAYTVLAVPLSKLFKAPDGRRGMWQFCVTFSNNAFMGYPVVLALCGEEGLALAIFFTIPFATIYYTLGVYQIIQDAPGPVNRKKVSLARVLVNPINVMIVLGLICYILQVQVPEVILSPIRYMSNVTTPMSMMVTGMALAQGNAATVFKDRDCFTVSFVRLLVLPILTLLVLRMIPFPNELLLPVMVLIMAMPTGSVSTMLAEEFGGNTDFAARSVFLTSLLCLITIPIVAVLI